MIFIICQNKTYSSTLVRIFNLSDEGRNYFNQDGTEGNDSYTTVTLAVNGASFTGSTVRIGSWATSDGGDIVFNVYDNFAFASGYDAMPWVVTHNSALDSIDVTMKDGSSIPPSNVSMSVNRNGGIVVRSQDIQGHDN